MHTHHLRTMVSAGMLLILGCAFFHPGIAQEAAPLKLGAIPTTGVHDTLHFGILLPPSYENSSHAYPVIYYMHGMNRYYAGPRAERIAAFFEKQMEDGQLPGFIMVFIDGGEGYWMDHCDGEPLLETAIMKYLVPYVDATYHTDASKRFTMGYSMGGNGAAFFYTKHPERFSAAISLDGGIVTYEDYLQRTGGRPEIISDQEYFLEYGSPYGWINRNRVLLLEKQDTSIFLSAALLKQANKAFLSALEAEGIPAKYIEVNCTHEFGCVFAESQDELIAFLRKMMGKN